MGRLQGKRALITGAGRGIGESIATMFAAEGAIVGVADIDPQTTEAVVKSISDKGGFAHAVTADLSTRDGCQEAVNGFAGTVGGLDVLVNNAMWILYDPLVDISEETMRRMVSIGFEAPFWTTQASVPHMEKAGQGSVIHIASPAAVHGIRNGSLYCGIKAGIAGMTRALGNELGPLGIRVNAIGPGPTPTPGAHKIVDDDGWKARMQGTPLRRHGDVEDHAFLAVFLASDESSFMTGELLINDGGRSMSA